MTLRRCRELLSIPRERQRQAGRGVCRSRAVLRCPVLKRIYLSATGYITGCYRRNEPPKPKVRGSGSRFISLIDVQLDGGAHKLLKLRYDARQVGNQKGVVIRESKATILRSHAIFFFTFQVLFAVLSFGTTLSRAERCSNKKRYLFCGTSSMRSGVA